MPTSVISKCDCLHYINWNYLKKKNFPQNILYQMCKDHVPIKDLSNYHWKIEHTLHWISPMKLCISVSMVESKPRRLFTRELICLQSADVLSWSVPTVMSALELWNHVDALFDLVTVFGTAHFYGVVWICSTHSNIRFLLFFQFILFQHFI